MKAVVIKINKNKAVVLKSDGTFHNVLNKGYVVGQEIYIVQVNKTASISRLTKYAVAAAAALIVLIGGFSYAYTVPQSYISMDINPSIEFEVNILGRVINPEGANKEGIQLLNKVSIKNKKVLDAIHAIVSQSGMDGYITQGDGKSVVLGVHSDNAKRQQKILEATQIQVENSLNSLHLSAQIAVNPITEQTIENAHNAGTTGGKLELIEEYLEAYSDGLSFDELMAMSVSDILYELNSEHPMDDKNEDDNYDDNDDYYDDDNYENANIEDDEHSEDEIDDEYSENSDNDSEQEQSSEPSDEEEFDDEELDDEESDSHESDDEEPDDEELDDEESDEHEEYYESSNHEEEEDS